MDLGRLSLIETVIDLQKIVPNAGAVIEKPFHVKRLAKKVIFVKYPNFVTSQDFSVLGPIIRLDLAPISVLLSPA